MDAFANLLTEWGVSILLIAIFAFFGTQLIKIPVKKLAIKKLGDEGKKKVTKYLVFLPIVLGFVGAIVDTWIRSGDIMSLFGSEFDWIRVLKETGAVAGLPAIIVAIVENFQEAHDNALVESLAEKSDPQAIAEKQRKAQEALETAQKLNDERAKKKAEKEKQRLEAEEKARLEREKKAQEARDKKINDLLAMVERLKNPTTSEPKKKVKESKEQSTQENDSGGGMKTLM